MKKLICIMILIFTITQVALPVRVTASANTDNENIEEELKNTIEIQLENLELENVEDLYNEFVVIEDKSFYDLIEDSLNGEFVFNFTTIFQMVSEGIKTTFQSKYKLLLTIILIAFISALFNNMLISKTASTFSQYLSYIFIVLISGIISVSVLDILKETGLVLSNISKVSEVIFPLLLALMASLGAVSSSALYQPAVTAITSIIIKIFSNFLFSIIIFIFSLTILGSLVNKFKLNKLNQFCTSLLKWVISIVFTLFMGYLSIQGITAGGYDGLSIKTAKYAIRNYIPYVGGYLAEGFEVFRGGSVLIKNSLGIIGIVILFSITLSPLIELIVLNLTFKLAGALTEIIGANEISNLLTNVAKIFTYLIAIIFSVFMMCFILFLLIIMTANMV